MSFITLISTAQASLDECFRDAKTHGSHTTPLSPVADCAELLRSHPDKIEAKSSDGKYHLFGLGYMLYVDSEGKRTLLSGDQTELKEILKIEINENKKRILVLQKDSVSTFNLEFIGNVSPLSYFKSPIIKHASRVKLLDNQEMIAIFSQSTIRIINAEAETRYEVEKLKPKLLNEISGEVSLLKDPRDLVFDANNKKIYVLDSNRVLVFPTNVKKGTAPLKVLNYAGAQSLVIKDGQVQYLNASGEMFPIQGNY